MQQFEAKEIGERIKLARLERGLTQEDLAEMASFSKRSLQDYETGVTIPYRHFRELGTLLGRSTEWFLYGEDSVTPKADRLDRLEGQVEEALQLLRDLANRRADEAPGEPE